MHMHMHMHIHTHHTDMYTLFAYIHMHSDTHIHRHSHRHTHFVWLKSQISSWSFLVCLNSCQQVLQVYMFQQIVVDDQPITEETTCRTIHVCMYIYIVFQKKIEKFFGSGAEVETASRILGVPKSKRSVEF